MKGLHGTPQQAGRRPQFLQGQVVPPGQPGLQPAALGRDDRGLAAGQVMAWPDVPGAPTLLEELLDPAQGGPEPVRHLGPGALTGVIRGENPFPLIQGQGAHARTLHPGPHNGYTAC